MCYMWVLFPFQIELSCGTKLQNLGSKAEGKGHKGGGGGSRQFIHNNFAFHK